MGLLKWLRNDPDPLGISQQFTHHDAGDILVVRSVQDVEPILKHNRELRREAEEGRKGYSPTGEFRRARSVPNILVHQWMMEGLNMLTGEGWPEIARRLDSNEFSDCRTAPGNISDCPKRDYPMTRRR